MNGIKWGIIACISAFLLSFLLGIIAGNQFARIFLTALVFGLLFFGMGIGFRVLVNNFFPELLFTSEQNEAAEMFEQENAEPAVMPLENTGEYAVPEMYRIPGKSMELGNIEDLISGNFSSQEENKFDVKKGIDDKPEVGYNKEDIPSFMDLEDELSSATSAPESVPVSAPAEFTPRFGDDEGLGGLPDLDAFTMAFSGGSDVQASPSAGPPVPDVEISSYSAPASSLGGGGFTTQTEEVPDRSEYKGNKPEALEGDFDAQEIAQGLRTLLNKDKN